MRRYEEKKLKNKNQRFTSKQNIDRNSTSEPDNYGRKHTTTTITLCFLLTTI
jgi:hypothetical protein